MKGRNARVFALLSGMALTAVLAAPVAVTTSTDAGGFKGMGVAPQGGFKGMG